MWKADFGKCILCEYIILTILREQNINVKCKDFVPEQLKNWQGYDRPRRQCCSVSNEGVGV